MPLREHQQEPDVLGWGSGSGPRSRLLLWLFPLAFLGAFFFTPLIRILALTFSPTAITAASQRLVGQVLGFTIWQAFLSTLLTLVLGIPAAWLFARYRFRGRAMLRLLTAIPFMLPTVVVAAGFNSLLGPRGWINLAFMRGLRLDGPPIAFVGTLGAILLAHVFYNTTIVIRIVGDALARLDPQLEQAANVLGANGRRVWWHVTLPLVLRPLLAAALLVFLFDFTSFGVILLLGAGRFSTLEAEIFVRILRLPNMPLAAMLSVIQLGCTFLFSVLYSRLTAAKLEARPRRAEANARKPRSVGERLFAGLFPTLLLVFFLAPLLALPVRSVSRLEADRGQRGQVAYGLTGDYYAELFQNRLGSSFYVPPIRAVANSVSYAVATMALSLALGLPAAFALARPTSFDRIAGPLLILPLGASAVTLGLGLLMTYGRWVSSPAVVPLAHTLVALPFVVRTLQPALASIPVRLREAASSLGASPLQVWRAVDWPILSRATAAAAIFAVTISLGEFGAALLITRPEYPTIPVAIYRFLSQPGGLNYGQAMAMATILMVVTAGGILTIERLRLPGTRDF
jgi:thiamine transport system permease protein